uniref:Uncharacterized protein n=1 Tax=Arundo donax TaxID=35708 RepID=A0A0A9C004_ARUDO
MWRILFNSLLDAGYNPELAYGCNFALDNDACLLC